MFILCTYINEFHHSRLNEGLPRKVSVASVSSNEIGFLQIPAKGVFALRLLKSWRYIHHPVTVESKVRGDTHHKDMMTLTRGYRNRQHPAVSNI